MDSALAKTGFHAATPAPCPLCCGNVTALTLLKAFAGLLLADLKSDICSPTGSP